MHDPAPPQPRTCQLGGCSTVLGRRQHRFCCREHVLEGIRRRTTNPDTKVCELPGCDVVIVRNHRATGDAEWARRRYCCQEHAHLGKVGKPQQQDHSGGSHRARNLGAWAQRGRRRAKPSALPCPVLPPAPRSEPAPLWRPNAPGWDPAGPRCVAPQTRATFPA